MKLVWRLLATMAVASLLIPAIHADDADKALATASKEEAINPPAAPDAAGEAVAAVPAPAALPPVRVGRRTGNTARVDVTGGYSFWRAVPINAGNRIAWTHGGTASVAYNFNDWLGAVADFGGYRVTRSGTAASGIVSANGNVFSYLFGPRLSFRRRRFTPFVQVLFGAVKASQLTLSSCTIGCTSLAADDAFAISAGGGLDLNLSRRFAIRLVQAEYLMTRFPDASTNTEDTATQNNVRLGAGLVVHLGTMDSESASAAAACSAEPVEVFAGEPVTGTASGANFNPKRASQYSWSGTGVKVAGANSSTQVDTRGLQPGSYQVNARLSDGSKSGIASCRARFSVKKERPPEIACASDAGTLKMGGTTTIRSRADSPDNRRLTYSYSTSAGNVYGTDATATLNTAGASSGSIRVTCTVSDDRNPALTASAATTVTVEAPPPPQPTPPPALQRPAILERRLALHSIYFQTARPTLSDPTGGLLNSQQRILTTLATDFKEYLGMRPEAHLTLEGHADPRGSTKYNQILTERRVDRTKRFLIRHGVPAANIEVRAFGDERNLTDEEVKAAVQQNPELSAGDRQRILNNMHAIILASNRRTDIVLSPTGQQSTREFPFNVEDSLTLISTQGEETKKVATKK